MASVIKIPYTNKKGETKIYFAISYRDIMGNSIQQAVDIKPKQMQESICMNMKVPFVLKIK